jgi:hypothetical protein
LARSPAVTVDTLEVGTLNGADRVHQLIVIDTFAKTQALCRSAVDLFTTVYEAICDYLECS